MATEWMESGYSIRKRKEKVDPRLSNRVIEWVVGSFVRRGKQEGQQEGSKIMISVLVQ